MFRSGFTFTLGLMIVAGMAGNAQADFFFSSSDTDASAGTEVVLTPAMSAVIHVWASTEDMQVINGVAINVVSDNAALLEGTDFQFARAGTASDPWDSTNVQGFGDLINEAGAAALTGPGFTTSGLSDFVLFGTVFFDATGGPGVSNLSITPGVRGISARGEGRIEDTITFGTATVVVAVPEPSSLAILLACGVPVICRRARKG
jgi:hypothetical protein